jgi:hypothetical protein
VQVNFFGRKRVPTVLRVDGFRFFFYSSDHEEPKHIHVEKGGATAKFWLSPIRLQSGSGFSRVELTAMEKIITAHRELPERSWDEYFDH